MSNSLNKFGSTVAELRKVNGWTQASLAKKLNVSDKTVSKWECGIGYPEITQIPILANLFGVTTDYLLSGESIGALLPDEFKWVNSLKKYSGNPIIRPHGELAADQIFNPAAIVHNNKVGLLCRCINYDNKPKKHNWSVSSLVWAWSDNGTDFVLDDVAFLKGDPNGIYGGGFEDPRLVWLPEEELYVLTYTGVKNYIETPGLIALSKDLKNWEFLGEAFPDRAVCIVPKKINGKYWAYYGTSSIFVSWSDDLRTWHTDRKPVLNTREGNFDGHFCESVASPIISENGIFLMYNGATPDRENFDYVNKHGLTDYLAHRTESRYSIGWALFDANEPTRLISRCDKPVLEPTELYELFGHVGFAIFGCGLVKFNSKYHLYYGCNDNRIAVAIEE